ncbi:hypothetical protein BJ742DRAFT_550166 [Cladochytrium replicatum]|nr:hypothetical protein BJ742DRAFT_550166 [Cladochytrium replicatum]
MDKYSPPPDYGRSSNPAGSFHHSPPNQQSHTPSSTSQVPNPFMNVPPILRPPNSRVARACDQCIAKKSRCSGVQPCGACIERDRNCTFDVPPGRPGRPRKHASTSMVIPPIPSPFAPMNFGKQFKTSKNDSSSHIQEIAPARFHPVKDQDDVPGFGFVYPRISSGSVPMIEIPVPPGPTPPMSRGENYHRDRSTEYGFATKGSLPLTSSPHWNHEPHSAPVVSPNPLSSTEFGTNQAMPIARTQKNTSILRQLSFDDDLPPLPDGSVQNMLIRNGLKLLGTILPAFSLNINEARHFPPVLQLAIQAAAFPYSGASLEEIQKGLSSPKNIYPLIERVQRSLSRLMDPSAPMNRIGYVVSTTFATMSQGMWDEFFAVDRYLIRAVLALCHALWLNPRLSRKVSNMGGRMTLSVLVDYSMRLGIHQNIRPPGVSTFENIEDQNLLDQMDERRMLWWSLFIFERSYFPLDEPAVKITQGMDLSVGRRTARNEIPTVQFSTLVSSVDHVPDYDPTSIAPIRLGAFQESSLGIRTERRAFRERLYALCIQDPKCVKVCERFRSWEYCGIISLHVLALSGHLARQSARQQGEWWTVETQVESEHAKMQRHSWSAFASEGSQGEFEDVDDDELEWGSRESGMQSSIAGVQRLAQLRKMVRRIQTMFAYNECHGKADENTKPGTFASATFPTFFWDMPVQKRPLGPTPLVILPAILSIAHSPSQILENLVQSRLDSGVHGLRGLIGNGPEYAMLVRWARSRYGGQLCWIQTQSLIRYISGIMQYVVWSQLHEKLYHSPLEKFSSHHGTYQQQIECDDDWCSTFAKEQGAQTRSINRSMMLNAQMVSIVWRSVAMTVVVWGLWEELGETEAAVCAASKEYSVADNQRDEAVNVDGYRSELISGVETVLKWITSTLTFCESNALYRDLLATVRDAVL